ncbi:MAG: hypothetical protein HPY54_03725 [Chthonomonadetes bacterium]|nr:hypothetical protein [Chthonomonadetes bacterium]
MPRGSFLIQPAASVWQLSKQVESTPVVAARYERHFGVPAAQFVRYVRSHLALRRLNSAGSYRVFHIKKDGTIGSQIRRLRKGTPVFMHLRTGQPVLLAECGNPMSTSLPGCAAPSVQNPPLPTADATEPVLPPQVEEPPLPLPVATLEPNLFDDPALAPMQMDDLPPWDADIVLSIPDLPSSHTGALAYASPAALAPLFTMGAGVILSLGGGSSGGRGGGDLPAVPEATSLLLWTAAVPLVAIHRWRRSRRRQDGQGASTDAFAVVASRSIGAPTRLPHSVQLPS